MCVQAITFAWEITTPETGWENIAVELGIPSRVRGLFHLDRKAPIYHNITQEEHFLLAHHPLLLIIFLASHAASDSSLH